MLAVIWGARETKDETSSQNCLKTSMSSQEQFLNAVVTVQQI